MDRLRVSLVRSAEVLNNLIRASRRSQIAWDACEHGGTAAKCCVQLSISCTVANISGLLRIGHSAKEQLLKSEGKHTINGGTRPAADVEDISRS